MVPSPDTNEFALGSILRIKLTNFLTYDSVVFYPGPNLNVIIGPNGTGKSSIVCAICLGLGGNASVLGRATDLKEFVQHGRNRAEIEIELKGQNSKNIVVLFRIKKEGTNEFFVDGKKTPKNQVLELARRYKIQVDNLCQFLAQDKVTEFARIKKQALLENTQKAVAGDLLEMHQKLKEKQGSGSNMKEQLEKLEEQKVTLDSDLSQLEPQYRAYHERQTREDHMEMLEKKKAYLEYEEQRKVLVKIRDDLKKNETELQSRKSKVEPAEKEYQQLLKEVERKDVELSRKNKELEDISNRAERTSNKSDQLERELEELHEQLERRIRDQNEKQNRIRTFEAEINNIKRQIAGLSDTCNVQPQIDKVNDDMARIQQKILGLEDGIGNTGDERNRLIPKLRAIEGELRKLENKVNVRVNALQRMSRPAFQLWNWYQDHRGLFQGPIYVPLLEMNLTDPKEAKFFETIIGERDLTMFICSTRKDNELLMRTMKELDIRANVSVAPNDVDTRSRALPQQLRNLGFRCYLSDLLTAPDEVMRYLCSINGISGVPIGTNKAEGQMENVQRAMQELKVFTVLTETKRVTLKISRYSGDSSVSDAPLKAGMYLSQNVEVDGRDDLVHEEKEIRKEMERLDRKKAEVEKELSAAKQKKEELRREKADLTESKNRRAMLINQQKQREKRLQEEKEETVDLTVEKNSVQKNSRKLVYQKIQLMEEMADVLLEVEPALQRQTEIGVEKMEKIQTAEARGKEVKTAKDALRKLEDEVEELKSAINEKRDEMTRQMRVLAQRCRLAPNLAPRNNEEKKLQDEFFESLRPLPKSIPEIETKINEERGRMAAARGVNEGIVEEYERKKGQSEALQRKLEQTKHQVETWNSDISKMKKQWMSQLEAIVVKISKNFSDFFSKLGCAGEVVIDSSEGEDDFANYGIGINVKFRDNEHMMRLCHERHSGGERSVATMLYMLALQELSEVPFRCVDEINQGMDAQNERTVFEMVVKLLSGSDERKNLGRTQYFMLTPKLLPNLTFSRNMAVQIVHNGSGMVTGSHWDMKKFIAKKRGRNGHPTSEDSLSD